MTNQSLLPQFLMENDSINKELDSINDVYTSLMQCTNQEELIQTALFQIRNKLKVQVASIFMFDKSGQIRRVGINGENHAGDPIDKSWLSDEHYVAKESFSGASVPETGQLAFGKPIYSNNILSDFPSMTNGSVYEKQLGRLQSGITVPLNGYSRTFGTIEVLNKKDSESFSNDEIYWLMLISANVSSLLHNFIREKKRNVYDNLHEKLASIIIRGVRADQIDQENILKETAEQLVADFTPFSACIIRVAASNDSQLKLLAKAKHDSLVSWNHRIDQSVDSNEVETGGRIVLKVFKSLEPDFQEDIRPFVEDFKNKDWISENKLISFACIPMINDNKGVGTISVYTSYHHKFSFGNKSLLKKVAFLLASIISRLKLMEDFEKAELEKENLKKEIFEYKFHLSRKVLTDEVYHETKNYLLNIYYFLGRIEKPIMKDDERQILIRKKRLWLDGTISDFQKWINPSREKPLNICELINDSVKLMRLELHDIDIVFSKEFNDEDPYLDVDEKSLKGIIYNLLLNSQAAIHDRLKKDKKLRGGQIHVRVDFITESNRQFVEIQVTDNGIGIPNESKPNIFKKGFTTRDGGTGLGLFTIKEAVERMRGRLKFDSKVDNGTTFSILVPMDTKRRRLG
jgi:GAF domain-containing protein